MSIDTRKTRLNTDINNYLFNTDILNSHLLNTLNTIGTRKTMLNPDQKCNKHEKDTDKPQLKNRIGTRKALPKTDINTIRTKNTQCLTDF